ncbi:carboxylesterase family protein [Kutzneria chonburiensis]|uniref:Carboxylic ester hydrolase n=1 Tax=Kutzneria chonburiensis TaxID=1483604 RepID=A0ABV6MQV3_9PSEU|nr:carboxylesterase family protein [Kutzneria chonburiensis]
MTTRVVRTADGPLTVTETDELLVARGVHYGMAERFAPAVAVEPWTDPVDATRPGPYCPQVPNFIEYVMGDVLAGLEASEDCLVLSVHAPRDAAGAPVMVYYHGGAYVTGSGESARYRPTRLAAEGKVVVVTVSYRVGIFGYLTPTREGVETNLGLRDQLLALRWVARNIASFGGDPANVTIFGQSAGGDSVASLLLSEPARGLYRRAITHSAPLGMRAGRAALHRAVRAAADEALRTRPRDLSAEDLLEVQEIAARAGRTFGWTGGMPLGFHYGEYPLPPESEVPAVIARHAPGIDLLLLHIRDDALPLARIDRSVARLMKLGPVGRTVVDGISKIATARLFDHPARRLAKDWRAAGGQAGHYRMDWKPDHTDFGSPHSLELPFLFGSDADWADAAMLGEYAGHLDERLPIGRELRAAWARFAHDGTLPAQTPYLHRLS